MNRFTSLILLVLVVCACGCSSRYKYMTTQEAKTKLIEGEGVFISMPQNGFYGMTIYEKSGAMTARAVEAELMNYTDTVKVSTSCEGKECFDQIEKKTYKYYFEPKIVQWEERATEWSGLPDRITVALTVYDTKNEEKIFSQQFSGASKWLTFGGDHPQDLLHVPIEKRLKSLYK